MVNKNDHESGGYEASPWVMYSAQVGIGHDGKAVEGHGHGGVLTGNKS